MSDIRFETHWGPWVDVSTDHHINRGERKFERGRFITDDRGRELSTPLLVHRVTREAQAGPPPDDFPDPLDVGFPDVGLVPREPE